MTPRSTATPCPLDADVLDVGRSAHGNEEDLRLEALLLAVLVGDRDGDTALVALDGAEIEQVAGEAGDATRLELLAKLDADRRVLERHQARKELHDGHVRSAAAVERSELDTDGSRTEHDRRRGNAVHLQRLIAGEDRLAICGNARKLLRARSGGDDDRPCVDRDRIAGARRDEQAYRARRGVRVR